jgi:hypothetical protein
LPLLLLLLKAWHGSSAASASETLSTDVMSTIAQRATVIPLRMLQITPHDLARAR